MLTSTVTVSAISETETRFEFSAIPGPQLTRLPHISSASIDGFLKDVGDFASGKLVVRLPTAEDIANKESWKDDIASNAIRGAFCRGGIIFCN